MAKLVQPTKFDGIYPNWAGFTFLDWDASSGSFHPGEDYNFGAGDQDLGQPVLAFLDGKVVYSGSDTVGYGNMIVVEHTLTSEMRAFIKNKYGIDTPIVCSLYAHLLERWVSLNAPVSAGQQIGRLGKSGVTYAHLHFEIYNPNGDLLNLPWRFYPIGWSQDKIKKNWIPPYPFIEAWNAQPTTSPLTPQQMVDQIRTLSSLPSDQYKAKVIQIVKG